MPRRWYRATGVVAVLLLLAACSPGDPVAANPSGSGPPGSASGGAVVGASDGTDAGGPPAGARPCALVTGAEAATALGLAAPLTPKTDNADACEYESGLNSLTVNLETQAYTAGTEDVVVSVIGKDRVTRVDGLGDAAFSVTDPYQVQYHVWAKGRYLFILAGTDSAQPLGPALKTLVSTAVSRL